MNKHLQKQQLFDSFYNEENYTHLSGDEPCFDPDCIDEENIYDMIGDETIEEIDMDELDLNDDEFMYL